MEKSCLDWLGGGGCSEPRLCHCTPAWATEQAKSSTYVIVQTLLELNYITTVQNNNKKYCLGIEAFSLGMKYVDDMSLVKQCSIYLPPIAEKYSKTAFVAVLQGTKVVYIYKYVAQKARLASCALGSRKDAYATSLGKAIIAFLPEEEQKELLDKIQFKALTENFFFRDGVLLLLPRLECNGTISAHYNLCGAENQNGVCEICGNAWKCNKRIMCCRGWQ